MKQLTNHDERALKIRWRLVALVLVLANITTIIIPLMIMNLHQAPIKTDSNYDLFVSVWYSGFACATANLVAVILYSASPIENRKLFSVLIAVAVPSSLYLVFGFFVVTIGSI